MKHINYRSWLPALTTLIVASNCFANSWTCSYETLTRHVVIFYPNAPAKLPCKVYYTKPNENVIPRTLWKAETDENFCDEKAAEFVSRLESWGWKCRSDNEL